MFLSLWHSETWCSKYRMPRCDLHPQARASLIAPRQAVSRARGGVESRLQRPVGEPRRLVERSGSRERRENWSLCRSKRVFLMVWQRRSCRRACLKARWWSWGSNDPKETGVEVICLQDLGVADSEPPRVTVECSMREAYLVKRRSRQEIALPAISIVIDLLSFSTVSRFTLHEIR